MNGKELKKIFEKDGWDCDRITGSHHIMKKLGKDTVSIPIHAARDLKMPTVNAILKKAGMR